MRRWEAVLLCHHLAAPPHRAVGRLLGLFQGRIEYRSRATKIIGQRFYIYAARKWAGVNGHDTAYIKEGAAPTGVIVGTATITGCTRKNGHYEWHLSDVQRMKKPRKPKGRPQPVWFRPF